MGLHTTGALRPLSRTGLQQDVSQCTLGLWVKPGREQTLQSRPRLVSRSAAAQILGLFETSERTSLESYQETRMGLSGERLLR